LQEVEAVKTAGQLAQLEAALAERGAIYLDVGSPQETDSFVR